MLLHHLISDDLEPVVRQSPPEGFVGLDDAQPAQIVDAQDTTAKWLTELGLDAASTVVEADKQAARKAFTALTTPSTHEQQVAALTSMKVPAAVQQLVGMLTAYDWEFVHQAQQIRGFVVAKLVELSESRNENTKIKALGLLGKVTEVGLFTDKVEVKKTDMTDEEIEQRIKDKIGRFMGVVDVVDVRDAEAFGSDQTTPPPAST